MGESMDIAQAVPKRIVYIFEDEYATKARAEIREYGFRALPVVDKNKRVVGVITSGDILDISSSKSNLLVKDIMTSDPYIITPDQDMLKVAKELINRNINRAIVVDSITERNLVGNLSLQDILRHITENDRKPRVKEVRELMSQDVVTCTTEDHVTKIWELMKRTGYSGLPVMKNGNLIGIVTRKDILKAGHARIGKEDERKARYRNPPKVESIMKTPAVSINPDAPVDGAAKYMLEMGIGRLPVLKDKKLVGIVTREDILGGYI